MRLVSTLALFLAISFFSGCAFYRSGRQSTSALSWRSTDRYDLGIIELDDQGWLWSRKDAAVVIEEIRKKVLQGPSTIVVFVHGWHHNAAEDDCNLESFKRVLERLDAESQLEVYRKARKKFYKSEELRTIGLYIGWRGASLPGLADYGTFWDRRPAAIRVGHGDLPEVFARLQQIYEEGKQRPDSYTGLVTLGHSFGGQVVFAAVSDQLKAHAAAAVPMDSIAQSAAPIIDGFGDLTVLVNPACDSAVYNAIDAMTRRQKYSPMQPPVMMILSSEGDVPNRTFFPIGRALSVIDEPRGQLDEYDQKIRAMGWVRSQLTHCLAVDGGAGCFGAPARIERLDATKYRPSAADSGASDAIRKKCPEAYAIGLDKEDALRNVGAWTEEHLEHPERIQLAGPLAIGGTRFYALDPEIDPNNPFTVVKMTRDISSGHNDMFNEKLVDFLIRYAAGTQIKRMAINELRKKMVAR
jgi:dienelactone hydrolase